MKARRIALIACLSMTLLAGRATAGRLFGIPDDGTADIVELDPLTGAEINRFASPGQVPVDLAGLAFDGTSLFYIMNGRSTPDGGASLPELYELDPDTGAVIDQDTIFGTSGTMLDGVGASPGTPGTVVIQDGADSGTGGSAAPDLFVYDPIADVMDPPVDVHASDPTFEAWGGIGLTSHVEGGMLMDDYHGLHFVDSTGALTSLASSPVPIYGVAVMDNEVFLSTRTYIVIPPLGGPPEPIAQIHVLDVTTGAWIRTMTTPQGFGGLGAWGDPTTEVIPEPASMALLGLGLAAVARRRRRK